MKCILVRAQSGKQSLYLTRFSEIYYGETIKKVLGEFKSLTGKGRQLGDLQWQAASVTSRAGRTKAEDSGTWALRPAPLGMNSDCPEIQWEGLSGQNHKAEGL